jgi:16S rRNA (uracil1498-N3)-methyltransferase
MKISNLPRIYANIKLIERASLNLPEDYHHYLKTVLRLKIADNFRIFNAIDGEFTAKITNITKNTISILLTNILRIAMSEAELILGMSIIKNDRMLAAINMAVQLGVTKIVPLIAERSQLRTINEAKLQKYIIESTEQSERLTPAILAPLIPLSLFLEASFDNMILYANEHENETNTLVKIPLINPTITIIIGPEGGFSANELKIFSSNPHIKSISLGRNILRAETAVAASIAQINLLRAKNNV